MIDNKTVLPLLSWQRQDIEQRFGFRGGRFTRVNGLLSGLVAFAFTVLFYFCLWIFGMTKISAIFPDALSGRIDRISSMFTERGFTPYVIIFLSFWSFSILFFKWRKLALQEKALDLVIVPNPADFVLSAVTVSQVSELILKSVDDPKYFVLLNRINIAISNLRNLGRVSDVDEILRSQADHDESAMETSYSLLRGFVWAIPVLGFIGTVMGLSVAIGGFGDVLGSSSELSEITNSLKTVTSGLATAFETTLIALVFALLIQMQVVFLKKGEEEFLDRCAEYCQKNVVNRLRIMPFELEED